MLIEQWRLAYFQELAAGQKLALLARKLCDLRQGSPDALGAVKAAMLHYQQLAGQLASLCVALESALVLRETMAW